MSFILVTGATGGLKSLMRKLHLFILIKTRTVRRISRKNWADRFILMRNRSRPLYLEKNWADCFILMKNRSKPLHLEEKSGQTALSRRKIRASRLISRKTVMDALTW